MQRLLVQTFVLIFVMLVIMQLVAPSLPSPGKPAPAHTAAHSVKRADRLASFYDNATVVRRDQSGQFHMTAQVNGFDTRFLVDTGADVVALTVDDAQRLGLDVDPSRFQPITQTASGVGYGAPVKLDSLEVGDTTFRNVNAVVIDGLTENLLGQSILGRLGKMEMQGDKMIIRNQ